MFSPLSLLAIEENEEVRLSSLKPKSSSLYAGQENNYDCGFELSSKLPCPSEERIESFKNRSYTLDSLGSLETSSSRVTHKNQINWSSIDDCVRYWDVLSKDDQYALRCLILSDTAGNSNRYGVKKRNLESHLLLHIGVDMTNIVNNGYDSVLTNLMHPVTRRYSSFCLDNRTVDAKTCRVAHYNFTKTYSTEALFKAGFVAYQCVISSDESYRSIAADPVEAKKTYQEFFKSTNKELSRLSHKRALINSYIYSNEISVDSIIEGRYRPHTHVLFFVPREKSASLSEARALEIEAVFNSRFNDRKMSLKKIERDEEEVPKAVKNNEECEKIVGYFYRAYSLADQYSREVREDNIELLNNKTRECYRTLVWMFKPSEDQKSFRHVAHSKIPKQGETVEVPSLQNKRKSSRIKKAVSLAPSSENSQTHELQRSNSQKCHLRNEEKSCQQTGRPTESISQRGDARDQHHERTGNESSADAGEVRQSRSSQTGSSSPNGCARVQQAPAAEGSHLRESISERHLSSQCRRREHSGQRYSKQKRGAATVS